MKKLIISSIVLAFSISLSASSYPLTNNVDPCEQAFFDTDADGNGCLNVNEFFTLGGSSFALFVMIDADNSGCISLTEFLGAGLICTKS